jgi:tetratricopeptide (TPR) repeat protein
VLRAGWVMVALALGSSACAGGASVTRVFHGRTVAGPEVSDSAYAAYARGAYLEAQGQPAAAIQAYRDALDADAHNTAIWTRLGALYCSGQPDEAEAAFADAIALDDANARAWSARAACRHSRRELDDALTDALRAVRLDPGDSAANLLVADIYRAQDRLPEAKAWLLALVVQRPEPTAHWAALRALAEASRDPALTLYATTELERRADRVSTTARTEPPARRSPARPSSELAAALREGDLPRARTIAAGEHIDARMLGVVAAANGYPALAERQANLVLEADPSDPDALIAALAAAQSSDTPERLPALLRHARADGRPSALGAHLLGDLLRWLVDERAAQAWLDGYERAAARPSPTPR